jgi:8-oxo-dGTP pyrophosphatase MutT (NUDIX family)
MDRQNNEPKQEGNTDNLREIHRTIASAFIFSKDGKLLMGKKDPTKGGVYSDVWHIPGGGVEDGETLEQAIIREASEEAVGLDLSRHKLIRIPNIGTGATHKTLPNGEVVWCNMEFNRFEVYLNETAEQLEARLQPSDDLVELYWFNRDELRRAKQIPGGTETMIEQGYIDE